MPKVVIPRLKRLRVEDYQLYPADPELGSFEHEFVPGVNVILGINGLGKTTLLNLMFRLLVGPYDPSKSDRLRPGRKQASIKHASIDFFRKRVPDQAVSATGTAVFAFGEVEVEVCRHLQDLRLVSYRFEGKLHEAGVPARDLDDELMELLCRLAGLDTSEGIPDRSSDNANRELPSYRYDFDFMVRNLVFFLEDKVPLIWNPEGQFVILRILLVNEKLSQSIALARNDLLQADSLYRNRVWSRGQAAEQTKEQANYLRKQGVEVDKRDFLASELEGADASKADFERILSDCRKRIDEGDANLLRTRAELYDSETELKKEEEAFFHAAFSTARSPGELIVQSLAGHQGCLVCGSRAEEAHSRARERLERQCCPVCESDVKVPEGTVSFSELRKDKLFESEKRVAALQGKFDQYRKTVEDARQDYEQALEGLSATRKRQLELRTALRAMEGVEEVQERLEALRTRYALLDVEVGELKIKLELAEHEHEKLILLARDQVEQFSSRIIEHFDRYARDFMVDDCRLKYKPDRRAKVGQGDRLIDWPAFYVQLSSGEDNVATTRDAGEEVSESQKEFIDLAFRMALMHAASETSPGMLVVETPEASLDAVFMDRAGRLLREFGNAHPENVLVVSSNLTGQRMIPSLLGVGLPDGEDLQTRMRRVINLLKRARPTKALNANRAAYEAAFAKAVCAEVGPNEGPTEGQVSDGRREASA